MRCTCPHCGVLLEVQEGVAGTAVTCPQCNQPFCVPLLQPIPELATASIQIHVPRTLGHRFKRAGSLLDIFDSKFEKYVTPLIIQITWIAVLLGAATWIVLLCGALLLEWLPETSTASNDEAVGQPKVTTEFRLPDEESGLTEAMAWVGKRVLITTLVVTAIVWVCLSVLWIRVLLETVIVVFNMAKTLVSIEQKQARL